MFVNTKAMGAVEESYQGYEVQQQTNHLFYVYIAF